MIPLEPKNPFKSMWLDGQIGPGMCDHDACICRKSYVDVYGFWRSGVEHSGVWRPVNYAYEREEG